MTNDTRPLTEDTREAIGRVIARWYKTGLLRFNSHDDGSDDLLLRDEIVRALAATRGEPPEPGPAIDVERLAEALAATNVGYLFEEGGRRPTKDAEAIAAEYDRLAAARGEPPELAIDVERRCPHCKLTATRIGDIHIDAQEIIERTQP